MKKIVNITSIEYGTITVNVAENATNAEIEEIALEIFNEGDTDWGDQETYIEVDKEKLPQLIFQDSTIYQLFDCDEWRSSDSIDATSPIAVVADKWQFAEMLVKDLKDEAIHLSENNKMFFEALDEEEFGFANRVLQAYLEQRIEHRHIAQINLGYKTN